MIKELILFLKSIFLIRCANKQNISGFLHIRSTIKNIKTTGKSKLLMLVGVFSTVGPFSYTKRTPSYKEELVSLSDVLESLFQSSIITYSQTHIKTGSCGHHGLQGFTFCWIYRDKYSTLLEPSTPEQAFKKVIQKFFYSTAQSYVFLLKKMLTFSSSQWPSEVVQGFLHFIEYTRFQSKGSKFVKSWLVNHMVSRVRMSWHIPQQFTIKSKQSEMTSADAKDLPMHQKWRTYLSSKENRTQNKIKKKHQK